MNRRQAPSVSYPVGPCVLYRRLLLGLWLTGVALAGAFAWLAGPAVVVMVAVLVGMGWLAHRSWRAAPSGELHWAGTDGWAWRSGGVSAALPEPVLVWRGRRHLLLQLTEGPRPLRWVWVERWRAPGRWDAFCRALPFR